MAASNVRFDPASNFQGKAEAITIDYFAQLNAEPLIAPPNEWWKPWCVERAGAKIKTRFYMPIHSPSPKAWNGHVSFDTISNKFLDVKRKVKHLGVKADAMKLAEFDFSAFAMAPAEMAKVVGKLPQVNFATLLNAAYTTTDWTGTTFARHNSGTLKPVCPGDPSKGTWYNAFQNAAMTPANIVAAIENLHTRLGFDGNVLDLDPMYLWVAPANKEAARNLVEVQRLIPTATGDADSAGNTTWTGGNDSPVFGRLKVVSVPGMRTDLWVVAAEAPMDYLKPLVRVLGGAVGEYGVNENVGGIAVPHIETTLFDRSSELYKTERMLGVHMIINEGWALLSSHCLCFNYTSTIS